MDTVPAHLLEHRAQWLKDPREASLSWWREARFGLFIHYGLYSQLGEGEWVQYQRPIPVAEYERLAQSFDPSGFDADFITDLALEAEMRYVTLVSCHHDSFCLWDSAAEPFNSRKAAGRDLVRELAEQCSRKGLGFFTYYTYHLNWRHPWFVDRSFFPMARPPYSDPEPRYLYRERRDFDRYVEYAHACIQELLTGYGPLAGVWLDLIMGYYARPDLMPVSETYALVRRLQPHCLVSFKQGATGEEDFATPEQHFHSLEERARAQFGDQAAALARAAWEKNRDKHNEICATLQRRGWGYVRDERHLDAAEVRGLVAHAQAHNCNLLLNTGPLPDGSIPVGDVATLRAVGGRIRRDGWPGADEARIPGEGRGTV
jgi:alpha-L-fucosidase